MLKALDSYHLFIKGIKVVPEVPSSETNAFGEKSIFGALYYQSFSRVTWYEFLYYQHSLGHCFGGTLNLISVSLSCLLGD